MDESISTAPEENSRLDKLEAVLEHLLTRLSTSIHSPISPAECGILKARLKA